MGLVIDTAGYFNPEMYEFERVLRGRSKAPLPAEWWDHDLISIGMLPVLCLVFGQAAFEAFLLDVLQVLSQTAEAPDPLPHGGLRKVLLRLEASLDVRIDNDNKVLLEEFTKLRNLWIHNGGVVTKQYLQGQSKLRPGSEGHIRPVHPDEVEYAFWLYDDIAREVLRAAGVQPFVDDSDQTH
jgi:hypothetical protein